jgi:uncharacterized protein YdaU (DUF1376 family)
VNYYRRYVGDYMRKTTALSLAEQGAYNVLLDTYYANEQPLPASIDALARMCRATSKAERDAVRSVAEAFFPMGEDGLRHNKRADEEIAKAQSVISAQRASGKVSAAKRWGPKGSSGGASSAFDGGWNGGSEGGLTDGLTHEFTDKKTYTGTDRFAIQPPTTKKKTTSKRLVRRAGRVRSFLGRIPPEGSEGEGETGICEAARQPRPARHLGGSARPVR